MRENPAFCLLLSLRVKMAAPTGGGGVGETSEERRAPRCRTTATC